MFITDALSLSHVPRWVVVPMLRTQTVAEHSFNVAMIAQELMSRNPAITSHHVDDEMGTAPLVRRENVIWHALTHDIDECVTGDIPGIAKQHMRAKRDIPDLVPDRPSIGVTLPEIQLVKLADIIESYTYCAKYGLGPHARDVQIKHLLPVLEEAINEASRAGLISGGGLGLMNLAFDIVNEKGRLRTFEEYTP